MKRTILVLPALALAFLVFSASGSADERLPRQAAASEQLPESLLALGADETQILSTAEADQIRGQWFLNLNFPLLATSIQGTGHFDAKLLTLSGGLNAGSPILVHIRIGGH